MLFAQRLLCRIGYAQVSTQDQNLELQRKALLDAECEKIFDNKLSGSRSVHGVSAKQNRKAFPLGNRPGLSQALEFLRDSDTLVVWKLDSAKLTLRDRLGRSMKHLVDLVGEQGVELGQTHTFLYKAENKAQR